MAVAAADLQLKETRELIDVLLGGRHLDCGVQGTQVLALGDVVLGVGHCFSRKNVRNFN